MVLPSELYHNRVASASASTVATAPSGGISASEPATVRQRGRDLASSSASATTARPIPSSPSRSTGTRFRAPGPDSPGSLDACSRNFRFDAEYPDHSPAKGGPWRGLADFVGGSNDGRPVRVPERTAGDSEREAAQDSRQTSAATLSPDGQNHERAADTISPGMRIFPDTMEDFRLSPQYTRIGNLPDVTSIHTLVDPPHEPFEMKATDIPSTPSVTTLHQGGSPPGGNLTGGEGGLERSIILSAAPVQRSRASTLPSREASAASAGLLPPIQLDPPVAEQQHRVRGLTVSTQVPRAHTGVSNAAILRSQRQQPFASRARPATLVPDGSLVLGAGRKSRASPPPLQMPQPQHFINPAALIPPSPRSSDAAQARLVSGPAHASADGSLDQLAVALASVWGPAPNAVSELKKGPANDRYLLPAPATPRIRHKHAGGGATSSRPENWVAAHASAKVLEPCNRAGRTAAWLAEQSSPEYQRLSTGPRPVGAGHAHRYSAGTVEDLPIDTPIAQGTGKSPGVVHASRTPDSTRSKRPNASLGVRHSYAHFTGGRRQPTPIAEKTESSGSVAMCEGGSSVRPDPAAAGPSGLQAGAYRRGAQHDVRTTSRHAPPVAAATRMPSVRAARIVTQTQTPRQSAVVEHIPATTNRTRPSSKRKPKNTASTRPRRPEHYRPNEATWWKRAGPDSWAPWDRQRVVNERPAPPPLHIYPPISVHFDETTDNPSDTPSQRLLKQRRKELEWAGDGFLAGLERREPHGTGLEYHSGMLSSSTLFGPW